MKHCSQQWSSKCPVYVESVHFVNYSNRRYETLQSVVFWDMTQCSLVSKYQSFGRTSSQDHGGYQPEDEGCFQTSQKTDSFLATSMRTSSFIYWVKCFDFPQSLQTNHEIVHQLDCNCFLPYPFQTIMPWSFYHFMLCNSCLVFLGFVMQYNTWCKFLHFHFCFNSNLVKR
jgi:hypothetical protein